MSANSPLIALTRLSPHRNSPRNQRITKITIHHTAGNIGLEALGNWLSQPATRASYNYGISTDGRIGLFVAERDRSWASSSAANDHQAVTIGVANNGGAPDWSVSDAAYESLIALCADICRRNGIAELVYDGTPNGSLTRHNFFSATSCPGPFLQERFPDIVQRVNAALAPPVTLPPDVAPWARDAWAWAMREGITDGTRPSDPVTRQEIVTMLHRYHLAQSQQPPT